MNTASIEIIDFSIKAKEQASLCRSEQETAVLMLYDNGVIRDCNQAATQLLNCNASQLNWQHISTILPELSETKLMQGASINPQLRFLSHIGHGFEVVAFNGVHIACALFFNEVESFGRHCLRLIIRPISQDLTPS